MADKSELFLEVIQQHKGIIYKIVHAYCSNPADRKDLAQEITYQLWRSFDTYNGQYRYSTWIYRIALNVAISAYRQEYRRRSIDMPFAEELLLETPAAPAGEELHSERVAMLYGFIAQVPELDRALLLLHLDGHSYQEIADIMSLTTTNVATKLSRIKQSMKLHFTTHNK
ncbi:MAG: sigma-70 family RNA polymerase sigma factor [Chitinophaga sp.]|uniref:RNA polymerase sigma factor n=1 Tax=Chitinophaga sp. TaxID=1869181 RepID=UPI0025C361DB|nr:sigma-70 family RNA polymerase sigma factor [Chitinophaga sp.]MBV8253595.1 sigma-70 family RNA polymerase sigma factor [Chitinophaga sp.]